MNDRIDIMTFDIEDWYNHDDYSQDFEWDKFEVRIFEGTEKILQALDENNIKGTFMCLGWVGEKFPELVRRIHDQGHHIGCHSYQHQLATRFTPAEFKKDTYKAKNILENVIGEEVDTFRVPSYSITKENLWAFDILSELGFIYDCSVFPSKHEFGGLPDFPSTPFIIKTSNGTLKEFPISLGKIAHRKIVFSGGGYFRVMPFNMMKKLLIRSSYSMSYFHPSDFDPGQPNMPQLPLMRQFKNRVALKGAYEKFQKYLTLHRFHNVRKADKIINWSDNLVIDISGHI